MANAKLVQRIADMRASLEGRSSQSPFDQISAARSSALLRAANGKPHAATRRWRAAAGVSDVGVGMLVMSGMREDMEDRGLVAVDNEVRAFLGRLDRRCDGKPAVDCAGVADDSVGVATRFLPSNA